MQTRSLRSRCNFGDRAVLADFVACPTRPKRARLCSVARRCSAPSGLAVCSRSVAVAAARRSSSASASASACGSRSERKRKRRLLQAPSEPAPRPRRPRWSSPPISRRSCPSSTMRYRCQRCHAPRCRASTRYRCHAPHCRASMARSRRRCVPPCRLAGRASCSSPSATPPSGRCCATSRTTAGAPASRTSWAQQHAQTAPLAAPQRSSCVSSGRAWRLWAARHSQ